MLTKKDLVVDLELTNRSRNESRSYLNSKYFKVVDVYGNLVEKVSKISPEHFVKNNSLTSFASDLFLINSLADKLELETICGFDDFLDSAKIYYSSISKSKKLNEKFKSNYQKSLQKVINNTFSQRNINIDSLSIEFDIGNLKELGLCFEGINVSKDKYFISNVAELVTELNEYHIGQPHINDRSKYDIILNKFVRPFDNFEF